MRSPAIAAAACFPPRMQPAGRPRSTTTSARSTKPRRSAPNAWCWSSAGCPRARATSAARGDGGGRHRGDPAACARRKMPLAIEPLHPMYAADRACITLLAQALDLADAARRGRRRRHRCVSRLVGPDLAARSRAPERADLRPSHLRLAGADQGPAARSRHDGRRRDRPPGHRAAWSRTRASTAIRRSRFSRPGLVEPAGRRGARTCIERYNSVC